MSTQYLSQEKYDELVKEKEQLEKVDMPATAVRIDDAREKGDLSENAEYHIAREELQWQKTRMIEIEDILDNAEIIEAPKNSDTVQVGSVVTVKVNKKEKEYSIVGAQEADPLAGKISNESPIGAALLGKKAGDKVMVALPAGEREYEVVKIA